jgi:hypothetical protein
MRTKNYKATLLTFLIILLVNDCSSERTSTAAEAVQSGADEVQRSPVVTRRLTSDVNKGPSNFAAENERLRQQESGGARSRGGEAKSDDIGDAERKAAGDVVREGFHDAPMLPDYSSALPGQRARGGIDLDASAIQGQTIRAIDSPSEIGQIIDGKFAGYPNTYEVKIDPKNRNGVFNNLQIVTANHGYASNPAEPVKVGDHSYLVKWNDGIHPYPRYGVLDETAVQTAKPR